MKRFLCATLFSLSMVVAAAPSAEAALLVQSKVNSPADAQHIAPFIRIRSDSATAVDINGWTVRYYFYIGRLPINYGSMTAPAGTTINVTRLSRTYTASNGLNANFMVEIKITQTRLVSISAPYDIGGGMNPTFSLASNPVSDFLQTDDWSYKTNTALADNANITLWQSATLKYGNVPFQDRVRQLTLAKQKIKHVIVIMQENRSFDNYFGAYPTPSGTLDVNGVLVPVNGVSSDGVDKAPNGTGDRLAPAGCNIATPFNPGLLTSADASMNDLPHLMTNAKISLGCPQPTPAIQDRSCSAKCGSDQHTCGATEALYIREFLASTGGCDSTNFRHSVGHYDQNVLGNYWFIAASFLLQDKMFAPVPSYSKVSHNFLVSAWSANCASGCTGNDNYDGWNDPFVGNYGWSEVTTLFRSHTPSPVTWAYYKGENFNHNCSSCTPSATASQIVSNCFTASDGINDFWNPLPHFQSVIDSGQTDANHISALQNFLTLASQVTSTNDPLPTVVWIAPGMKVSEHPQGGDLRRGQAYTTMILQQIMKNPTLWQGSAVFLAWDDWGGFYDHVRPPVDTDFFGALMYGMRVPGLTVSPWIGAEGGLDHQTLSFDAYLKLMEDLYVGGQRVGITPWDGRAPAREDRAVLGNLLDEFDFNRTALSPPPIVTSLSCQSQVP
jgi:phospholipase C